MPSKGKEKKNGKVYYYYQCNNCKITIKEPKIEETIKTILGDILEYDNVVNEFFLPVLKSKVEDPKEELGKELKSLKSEIVSYGKNQYGRDSKILYRRQKRVLQRVNYADIRA